MAMIAILLALLLSASPASAQPAVFLFGGYLYAHPDFENVHLSMGDSLNGWLAGVDVSVLDHISMIARVDGSVDGVFRQGLVIRPSEEVRSALYTVTAGPRVSATRRRVTAF